MVNVLQLIEGVDHDDQSRRRLGRCSKCQHGGEFAHKTQRVVGHSLASQPGPLLESVHDAANDVDVVGTVAGVAYKVQEDKRVCRQRAA